MDNFQRTRMMYLIILGYLTLLITMVHHTGYDTYWHIKAGEWSVVNLAVPDSGIFSFTKADAPWTPHSWLSSVIIYGVYSILGWPGLTIMAIAMVTLSVLIMLKYLLEQLPPIRALCLVIMAYGLLYGHIMPRPHIIALPVMTFWFVQMLRASEQHKSPSLYNLPVIILWANIHGSFLIAIPYAIFFAVEAITTAPSEIDRIQLTRQWAIFLFLSALCLLLTPHGLQGVLLPLQLTDQNYAMSRIGEWRSPNFQHFQFLELWIMAIIAFALTQRAKLPVLRLIFLMGLIHLSLKHGRYSSDLMSLQAPLILAAPLARHWNILTASGPKRFSIFSLIPVTLKGKIFLTSTLCLWLTYVIAIKDVEFEHSKKVNEILTTVKQSGALGNVFNSYDLGGFLIYQGFDTFIDSRAELYRDEFIKKFMKAVYLRGSEKDLEDLLEQNDIHWTILSSRTPSIIYFNMTPEWVSVFSSDIASIHIRRDQLQNPKYQILKENLKKLEKTTLEDLEKTSPKQQND